MSNRSKETLIYALIDPRDQTIFYVGQSRRGSYEPEWYIKSAHRGSTQRKVKAKLRQIHLLGLKTEWCILEETDDLDIAETFWICSLLATGANLTNMKFGGYGAKSTRHPDTGKNISKARKGQPNLSARKPESYPMVSCAVCDTIHKTYLRPADREKGKDTFFCSKDCLKVRACYGV